MSSVASASRVHDRASLPFVNNGSGNCMYCVTFLHEGASGPVTYRTPASTARDAWAATVRYSVQSLRAVAYQCLSIEPVLGHIVAERSM